MSMESGSEDVLPNGQAPDARLSMPVHELNLSARTLNCLRAAGIETVGDLTCRTAVELLTIRNLGGKSVAGIEEKLRALGLTLASAPLATGPDPASGQLPLGATAAASGQAEAGTAAAPGFVTASPEQESGRGNGRAARDVAPAEPPADTPAAAPPGPELPGAEVPGAEPPGDWASPDLLPVPALKRALPVAAALLALFWLIARTLSRARRGKDR